MRHRESRNNEEQKPTNTLRRSPRFLRENKAGAENHGTQKPAARKISSPDSSPTSLRTSISKTQKGGKRDTKSKSALKSSKGSTRSAGLDSGDNLSRVDLQKQFVTEKWVTRSSGKSDKKVVELKESKKTGKGSRRSARLDAGANGGKIGEILDLRRESVVERRITRSSIRGRKFVNNEVNESDFEEDSEEIIRFLSKKGKPEVGVGSCKQSMGNIEKRVTRSSGRTEMIPLVEKASNLSTDSPREMVKSSKKKHKGDGELSKLCMGKRDVKDGGIERGTGEKSCKRNMPIGGKRKRRQVVEECEIVQGWTEEQELALRRAYFTSKPTPHFWKEVARMVPGKSAKECFDRIHLDHLTPSQPRKRSRANKKELSPISFSASKLLSPADMKIKKLTSRRRKFLAQKTVRQLLQKRQNEDQHYEADLFAVLEPTIEPSLNFQDGRTVFASPVPNQRSGILTRCREMTSSSAHKKYRSRLNSAQKAAFVSPPVLKQVKNKALHEKYIDQLHCRDAKRKAESLRNARRNKNEQKASQLQGSSVKVAKDAQVFDAQDAIFQFRSLQSRSNNDTDYDDDDASCNDEDEDEDEDKLC